MELVNVISQMFNQDTNHRVGIDSDFCRTLDDNNVPFCILSVEPLAFALFNAIEQKFG